MNRDDNLLRWAIPGWVFVFSYFMFVFFDRLTVENGMIYEILTSAFRRDVILRNFASFVVIAASGIPIGFFFYQIYFYIRWNSPLSENGLLPPLIVGRRQELKAMLRDLKDEDLDLGSRWRDKLVDPEKDYRGSWHYLSQLLDEAFLTLDPSGRLAARHRYFLNTLHTLGTSHLSFTIGFTFFLITKFVVHESETWWIVIAFLIVLTIFIALEHESFPSNNPTKLKSAPEIIIGIVFFLYLNLNQNLDAVIPDSIRLLTCLAIGYFWGYVQKDNRLVLWGITIVLSISTLVIHLTRWMDNLNGLNWDTLLVILIFCSISLVFLKNRQNTRNSLGSMEYYNLRKYFENLDPKVYSVPKKRRRGRKNLSLLVSRHRMRTKT